MRDGARQPAPTFKPDGSDTAQPRAANPISNPARPSPKQAVVSWLGVPLLSGGHLLGALVVTSTDPRRRFGDDDLRQLNIVAAATSVALENAQLYRQQKERVSQLATLNRIVALLTDTLSPDTVIDTVISSASTIAEVVGGRDLPVLATTRNRRWRWCAAPG